MRKNRHERDMDARCNAARDAGEEWHKTNKEALLASVWREASARFPASPNAAFSFVEGFTQARAQRDAFLQEQKQ